MKKGLVIVGLGIMFALLFHHEGWHLRPLMRGSSGSETVTAEKPVVKDESVHPDLKGSSSNHTLSQKVQRLNQGFAFIKEKNCYSAQLRKRELVHGHLLDEEVMHLKFRQSPFSVYLNWVVGDAGREVVYVEGRNQGRMIGHDGGWKARIPALSLPIDCAFVMRDSRYPISSAGVGGLIETMLKIHQADLEKDNVQSCEEQSGVTFEGHACNVFTTQYKSKLESPVYRKSVTYIDSMWSIPLHSRHFEWPATTTSLPESELDEATLIESYAFSDINFEAQFTDRDFDSKNPEYHFR